MKLVRWLISLILYPRPVLQYQAVFFADSYYKLLYSHSRIKGIFRPWHVVQRYHCPYEASNGEWTESLMSTREVEQFIEGHPTMSRLDHYFNMECANKRAHEARRLAYIERVKPYTTHVWTVDQGDVK